MLDTVDVHGDVADVAGEPHPAAVGRDVEGLGDVGAVEQQGVGTVPALDDIAAVSGVPLEYVVPGAERGSIVALVPVDEIVAIAADQRVSAVAAENSVVAGAAVDRQIYEGSQIACRAEAVVTAVHVEDEVLGRAYVEEKGRGGDTVEAHARTVGGDGEDLAAIPAVDLGGVVAVAALEQVAVVAGVPDHAVVAALAEHLVVAISADQRVVARAAEQQVVAAFAQEGVVAGATS